MSEHIPENKMGVMPVGRLLLSMALPIMISMLVQAFYNVVDSIFVSRISEEALTAVSLAFPIQNLMIAVASGTGVGINALLSRSLGEKNMEEVNRSAGNGLLLAALSYLVILLFGLFCVTPFYRSQTLDADIVSYGQSYLSIVCIFGFGIFLEITGERILQATGKTFFTMITQGTGAILNIIFDPILIFGLFGFPRMGIAGAAAATVLGQIVAAVLAIVINLKKNHEVSFGLRWIRPHLPTIRRIYVVGLPSIIMMSISSVMTFCLNKILIGFTATAAAVLGVYFKLQSFIFMPIFGLNNGMIPIIAYNYGARKPKRMMRVLTLSILYATCIMIFGIILFFFFPDKLLSFFNASPEMLAIGIPALRIICLSFLFAGFCIICSAAFQAWGHGIASLIVSVVRQLFVLVPVAYLLSLTGRLELVWLSFPIAEIFSLALSLFFLRKLHREIVVPMLG